MRFAPLAVAAILTTALAACASTSPPPVPSPAASTSPAASATPIASETPTTMSSAPQATGLPGATGTPSAPALPRSSASASASLSTVPGKSLNTVRLPMALGTYRAQTQTGATGEQVVQYGNPNSTFDLYFVTVSTLSDAATVAHGFTGTVSKGPALCGMIPENSKTAACVLPLDRGMVLINGTGVQTLDQTAAFAQLVWAAIP